MATVSSPTPTPDPLLETQMFWMRHKTTIVGGILALILGVAVYGGYRWFIDHRNNSAAAMLAQAKTTADYEKVIGQYPRAAAAPSAYLLLAAAQRNEQKLSEASSTLKTFIDKNPKHELVTTAKMALAANVEATGKPDEALEMFRRLAVDHPRSFNAPLALLAQVPLLKAKGDIQGARQVCETVLSQYSESYASTEATRQLRVLKVPGTADVVSAGVPAPAADSAALEASAAAAVVAPPKAPASASP